MSFSFPTEAAPSIDLGILHDLPSLPLRAKYLMDGFMVGIHRSLQKGFSAEFADYRGYQPGDDLRRIDWRLYGRTDRLYIKRFEEEIQLKLYLILDVSRSMAYASDPARMLQKFDYARTIAASLAMLAQKQGDSFGLGIIGLDLEDFLKARRTPLHWQHFLGKLSSTRSHGNTGLAKGLYELGEVISRRSLVVVLSDFYEEENALCQALGFLRHRNHEIIAMQVLDPVEMDFGANWSGSLFDLETGQELPLDCETVRTGYLRRFQSFQGRLEGNIRDIGGDFVALRTDIPPSSALGSYLAMREKML